MCSIISTGDGDCFSAMVGGGRMSDCWKTVSMEISFPVRAAAGIHRSLSKCSWQKLVIRGFTSQTGCHSHSTINSPFMIIQCPGKVQRNG
jgi:hypothetical protein